MSLAGVNGRRIDGTGPGASRRSHLAVAVRYALTRWAALTRYAGDGRLQIDNSAAERSLRGVARRAQELTVRRLRSGRTLRRQHLQPRRDRDPNASTRAQGQPADRLRSVVRHGGEPERPYHARNRQEGLLVGKT